MIPERTNYLTNGVDGVKRLAQGPELSSYRGLQIIPTRKFSMDAGTAPRDLLKRRVRVAEYYRIPWQEGNDKKTYEFYDQSRDTMFRLTYNQLVEMSSLSNGGTGSARAAGNKRKITFLHDSNDWNPTNVTDEANIASSSKEGGLYLPSTVTNNGRNLRTRYATEETTGANLSSQETNMSVKDALNSIATQDYHIASEMFGGGLFNDTIQKNSGVETNFDAIKHPTKSIGHTFVPWLMAKIMNMPSTKTNALGSLFEQTVDLEDSINSGTGIPSSDCIIKMLWHRACNLEADLKHLKTSPESIVQFDRTEIVQHLENPIIKKSFENFVKSPKTKEHLFQFFEFDIEKIFTDLPTLLNEFQTPIETAEVKEAIKAAKPNAHKILDNFHTACKIVADPALEASYQYMNFVRKWSSDIVLERAIKSFINVTDVKPLKSTPIGGQAHEQFHKLKPMIKADFISREFNGEIQHYGGHFSEKNANSNDIETITKHFMNHQYMSNFKQEMKNHEEDAVIASNVANAGSFQEAFRPNLHISRCQPLSSADVDSSLSSMNENTWLLQHLASTMPLSSNVCTILTSMANGSNDSLKSSYKQFLTGSGRNAEPDPYNTLLMHWYMSKIHPDDDIRRKAGEICNISRDAENNLVDCIANLLDSNTTIDAKIESAFNGLRSSDFIGANNGFYCPGFAASQYPNFPSYVTRRDQKCSCLNETVEWVNMPVVDFESFNADKDNQFYYNPETGRNESTVDAVHIGERMPWVYRLSTKSPEINRDHAVATMSGLKCHWFLMDFAPGTANAMDYRNSICGSDLAHLCSSSARYCASNTDIVIKTLLPILANRFWKPTSRAMLNGAGVPMAKPTNDNDIISTSLQQTNSPSPQRNLKQHWVVQGTGYHLTHGPSLPVVGSPSGALGKNNDIVILRPNIEHEMLGVIMGRGGTQELGATFWYVCDKLVFVL